MAQHKARRMAHHTVFLEDGGGVGEGPSQSDCGLISTALIGTRDSMGGGEIYKTFHEI